MALNPKAKKFTPHQEELLALSEKQGIRAEIIEQGVAVMMARSPYTTQLMVCRDMLDEAIRTRQSAHRNQQEANRTEYPKRRKTGK